MLMPKIIKRKEKEEAWREAIEVDKQRLNGESLEDARKRVLESQRS